MNTIYKILSYVPGMIEDNVDTAALLDAVSHADSHTMAGAIRSVVANADKIFRSPAVRDLSVELLNLVLATHP